MRIALAFIIAQFNMLDQIKYDLSSPSRCTESGYNQIYEEVSKAQFQALLTPKERYTIIINMRYNMCNKVMYSKYDKIY